MGESLEMYLVTTVLLRESPQQPVPISLLASRLAVTSVSANEMCRKLNERGLVAYQPYKGVTLTADGEKIAQQIISRRRLWGVFLVETLGIGAQEAEELACQLEHITSEHLVAALGAFLERRPAERAAAAGAPLEHGLRSGLPLTACAAGTRALVVSVSAEPMVATFLRAQGIQPDVPVEVLAIGAGGAVLLGLAGGQVALAPAVARCVTVRG